MSDFKDNSTKFSLTRAHPIPHWGALQCWVLPRHRSWV